MNEAFRTVTDGTESKFEALRHWENGTVTEWFEIGEIYYPFAIHIRLDDRYCVTHLPSGYRVETRGLSRYKALRLIERLRESGADWEFVEPTGDKWEAVRAVAKPIVARYK